MVAAMQVRYAEPSYWEERYSSTEEPYEWFLGYTALRRLLKSVLLKKYLVLHVGCGTSKLQEEMSLDGYTVINVGKALPYELVRLSKATVRPQGVAP